MQVIWVGGDRSSSSSSTRSVALSLPLSAFLDPDSRVSRLPSWCFSPASSALSPFVCQHDWCTVLLRWWHFFLCYVLESSGITVWRHRRVAKPTVDGTPHKFSAASTSTPPDQVLIVAYVIMATIFVTTTFQASAKYGIPRLQTFVTGHSFYTTSPIIVCTRQKMPRCTNIFIMQTV